MVQKRETAQPTGKRAETAETAPVLSGNAYRQVLRALRGAFVGAGLFSALINVLMLTGSLYMLQVYDRVLASGSVATLQGLLVIVTLAYAFYGFYEFLRSRILSRAAMRLNQQVGPATFRAWLRPNAGQERGQTQPLRDLELLRAFLSGPAMGGIFDLPWMPLYLAILFLIHPLLGWLTVGGVLIGVATAVVNHLMTKGATERAMMGEAQSRSFADQGLRQAEAIEAMGMQAGVIARWRMLQGTGLAAGQGASDVTEVTSAFSKAFRLFLQSAILSLGAWLVLRQEMSAGMIIACSVLSGRAMAPADQIIGQWRAISKARVAHGRLAAFFEREAQEPARIRLPAPTGQISVAGLTRLGPPVAAGERRRLLQQVSFDLAPGEGMGVIGDSASGKSTLARLIVGAWTPDAGEIRLDGATRAQWDSADLGRHIGYLPQVVEMLPGTVRDNISRFDPAVRDADVIDAAKLAGVHEMILALPEGYNTLLGGGLQPLSGGQMQRLGLARAIYGNPRIVVLDEPNSNLDGQGDAALMTAITTLKSRGASVIMMTHRISALSAMDKIMILAQGRPARYGLREAVLEGLGPVAVAAPASASASASATASGAAPDAGPDNIRPFPKTNIFAPDQGEAAAVSSSRLNLLNALRRRTESQNRPGTDLVEGEAV